MATLIQGGQAIPDNGSFPYHLAMVYIRTQQHDKAVTLFEKAVRLSPDNVQFRYVYSLSLQQSQPQQAEQVMRETYEMSRQPQHLYSLCEMQIKHKSKQAKACVAELKAATSSEVVQPLEFQTP